MQTSRLVASRSARASSRSRTRPSSSIQGGTATPAGSVAFFLCKVDAPGAVHVGRHRRSGSTQPQRARPTQSRWSRRRRTSPRPAGTAGAPCSAATPPTASAAPSDSTASECFTVNPVTPTLSTTAGADVDLGQPGHRHGHAERTATAAGQPGHQPRPAPLDRRPAAPSRSRCSARATAAVAPLVFTSADRRGQRQRHVRTRRPFTPTVAGNYHWVATYSGNRRTLNGDAQRGVHRHQRGRHRHHGRVVADERADAGCRTTR